MNKKGRVFSGARPTGRQHLGNYLGAIRNYVALQADYDCVYCVVDLHALTTMETTRDLQDNTYEMALDWLAAGIDPQQSIVFVQSHVAPDQRIVPDLQHGLPARQAHRPADLQRESAPAAPQRQPRDWSGTRS